MSMKIMSPTSLSWMGAKIRPAKTFVRAAAVAGLAYVTVAPGHAQVIDDFLVRMRNVEETRKIELELADALDNNNKDAIDSIAKRIKNQNGADFEALETVEQEIKGCQDRQPKQPEQDSKCKAYLDLAMKAGPCELAGILIRFIAIGLSEDVFHAVKQTYDAPTPSTVWELDIKEFGEVNKELLDKILGLDGHLLVQPLESPLTDWKDLADRISQVQGVRLAAPVVDGEALASSPVNVSGVVVRGMRADDLNNLTSIAKNIRQGTLEGFDEGQGGAIGRRLADQLSVHAGDSVTLVAPRGAATTPRIKSYKIAAVFEIGMSGYDSHFVFMPLPEAQAYFDRNNDVTAIEVFTTDPDRIDTFRKLVTEAAGRPVFLQDWRERNSTFFNALQAERNVMKDLLAKLDSVNAAGLFAGNMSKCELIEKRGIPAERRIGTDRGREELKN